jgi:uncharacterized membrane protein YkvA (DUF1232 family)
MGIVVRLELSDAELEYFRAVMRRVRVTNQGRTAEEIQRAAAREVARLRSTARSAFVQQRLDRVGRLIAMLDDPEWQLPEEGRRRALDALAYVADSCDLVPDNVPALGLLDDAIMLELVIQDLRPELEGYEEFDAYRASQVARGRADLRTVSREDWLDSRREALHARIRDRRERDEATHGGSFDLITRL